MYKIPQLPLPLDLKTEDILKKLIHAHRALAELKGVAEIIPNQSILISTLSLQEAKESSAIENIVTTHDELYKSSSASEQFASQAAKEVHSYASALRNGYERVKKYNLLTNNQILDIQASIEENGAGFRALPGTELKNEQTGEVIYTPPQDARQIKDLMENLEKYINDDSLCDTDPLIKMAIIHHQFESIHPFYDGNGRTGRIINVLYLVKNKLLDAPLLYLSRYINQNKNEYYRLLQAVRKQETAWKEWVMFMLEAVMETSYQTIRLIQEIRNLMQHYKHQIRSKLPKIYSHNLLNTIFSHPYTKSAFIEKELGNSRVTAIRYLDELTNIGLMRKLKAGREVYYVNTQLFEVLSRVNNI